MRGKGYQQLGNQDSVALLQEGREGERSLAKDARKYMSYITGMRGGE